MSLMSDRTRAMSMMRWRWVGVHFSALILNMIWYVNSSQGEQNGLGTRNPTRPDRVIPDRVGYFFIFFKLAYSGRAKYPTLSKSTYVGHVGFRVPNLIWY